MYILGISPDGEYLKVALISLKRGKLSIETLEEFQKDLFDSKVLREKIGRDVKVSSPLGCDEVFIRHIDLPLKSTKNIFKALPFQMEALLPFPDDTAITLPLIKRVKQGSRVSLYSIVKERMKEHLQEMNGLGFDSDIVSCIPMALHRFASHFTGEPSTHLIFHFRWENSDIVYVQEGAIKKAITLNIGFKHLIDSIELPNSEEVRIDEKFIKGEIAKNPKSSFIENFKKQAYRVMEFLSRKEELAPSVGILFTGYADVMKDIFSIWDESARPHLMIKENSQFDGEKLALFAIEIGLGLDGALQDKNSLQFRLGSFTPKRELQGLEKKAKIAVSLFALCSILIFSTVGLFYVQKQHSLSERFYHVAKMTGENGKDYPSMGKLVFNLDESDQAIKQLMKKVQLREKEDEFADEPRPFAEYLDKIVTAGEGEIAIEELSYTRFDARNMLLEVKFTAKEESRGEQLYHKVIKEIEGVVLDKTTFTREKDGYQLTIYVEEKN